MATQVDPKGLDIRAQMASIDEALANAARARAEISQRTEEMSRIQAETRQREIETRMEPWKVALGGVTSGAALFAAAAAFTKLFL